MPYHFCVSKYKRMNQAVLRNQRKNNLHHAILAVFNAYSMKCKSQNLSIPNSMFLKLSKLSTKHQYQIFNNCCHMHAHCFQTNRLSHRFLSDLHSIDTSYHHLTYHLPMIPFCRLFSNSFLHLIKFQWFYDNFKGAYKNTWLSTHYLQVFVCNT